MKLYKAAIAILLSTAFSLSIFAHDPKGESFQLSGKLTSVELTDEGGVITVSAGRDMEKFLTSIGSILPA